jgi:putative tricarboxylic transport membrane protein
MGSFSIALDMALGFDALIAVVLGAFVGLVFGSIPGLTFSMALALVLPLTFAMDPTSAIALLLSTYIGGMTGGSVSAILVGIPGTPSAAATVLDGYPLAKQGMASEALGMAVLSSVFGGLFSLGIMILLVDVIADLAIQFGPAEIFALVLFGLSTICGLAERSLVRGLIAGTIGLMLMIVGLDEIEGIPRMTFGSTQMLQGVNLLVAMIGLFAVPHIIRTFLDDGTQDAGDLSARVKAKLPSLRQIGSNFWLILRCAIIGTGIGAVPGTGGPIAAFIAYDHARRFSRNRENLGKGELAGVAAPESANNAVTGGAMIPLLSLGIPGDPATAIVLGGLLIHGLNPGPMLFVEHLDQIYALYISVVLAYLAVLAMQIFGIRIFVRVLRIPPHLLAAGILVMCGIGSYAIRNSFLDIYTMAITGLLGYVLMRLRIPVTPIILGLVLGKTMENEYRTALILSDGSFGIFVESGWAILFLTLTVVVIGMQVVSQARRKE